MLSNSGERWLISITDMPEPCQSSSSSRMRSSTESGRALGPALKLWTRFTAVAAKRDDTIRILSCVRVASHGWQHSERAAHRGEALQNNTQPSGETSGGNVTLTVANRQE